jgi:hypothetical protein
MNQYAFIAPPKYVGGYQIGGPMGLQINFEKRPNWLHRKMMRLCLGWEWVDV